MSIEHWVALVSPIPGVERIMRKDKPDSISNVLLLVVFDFHELISEIVVVEELVVVVSKNKMLLALQVLQDVHRGLGVVARDVSKNEYMVFWLDNGVPVILDSVVVVLRPIELVVGERHGILRPPEWVRVCLIAEVYI